MEDNQNGFYIDKFVGNLIVFCLEKFDSPKDFDTTLIIYIYYNIKSFVLFVCLSSLVNFLWKIHVHDKQLPKLPTKIDQIDREEIADVLITWFKGR